MAAARPALFPRIWDEQMNLVLDKGMCSPQALSRWGMVGYSDGGGRPDRRPARGKRAAAARRARRVRRQRHGHHHLHDGANQLLALPENIALLREGRIVIVYDTLETQSPTIR